MTAPWLAPDLFERFGLAPESDGAAITEALRERAETASPEERPEIRAAWETLTRRPEVRVGLALGALPSPAPPGPPPPSLGPAPPLALALDDLVALPRLGRHLPPPSEAERALDRPRTEGVGEKGRS